jgi:glutamyl-tRNA synthetase
MENQKIPRCSEVEMRVLFDANGFISYKHTMFRTRQAPSPTGYLHFGTARTMLFTKLFALKNDGTYYLRLEDTDRNRLNPDAALGLLKNLQTLGLEPDEGVTLKETGTKDDFYGVYQHGEFGPYIQSERRKLYHTYAQKLVDMKLAYWSFLTAEDKDELQQLKTATKRPINYFKACSERQTDEMLSMQVIEALSDPRKPALMYKLQRSQTVLCQDELLDATSFDLSLEEDFVILKSDGYPTYHLAHIVDDYLMQTSLVIRSQEWYPSFPKHVAMYSDCFAHGIFDRAAVEWVSKHPAYLHLPFILGETGNKKMSKRDGNVNMQDYLNKGYLPEAIINYLAFLGWNPGTEKELYLEANDFNSLSQQDRISKLIQNIAAEFDLEKLSKSPARFNLEKLNWYNREYIKLITHKEWYEIAQTYLPHIDSTNPQTQLALLLDKNRITTLSEFGSESSCILDWHKPNLEDVKWKKITLDESLANLKEITHWLFSNQEIHHCFDSQNLAEQIEHTSKLEIRIKQWLSDNKKDTGSYLWPLRVALSGKAKSPTPFEILAILTQEEIRRRINIVLSN